MKYTVEQWNQMLQEYIEEGDETAEPSDIDSLLSDIRGYYEYSWKEEEENEAAEERFTKTWSWIREGRA